MFSSKPVHLVSDVFPKIHHNSIVSDSSAVLTNIELVSNFDTIKVRLMLLFNRASVTKHTSMSCFGLMPCFHCSIYHHISCPWFRRQRPTIYIGQTVAMAATGVDLVYRKLLLMVRLLWLRLLWLLWLDNCCSPHKAPSGKSHQKKQCTNLQIAVLLCLKNYFLIR